MKKNTFYSLIISGITTLLFINCSATKDSLSITENEEQTFKQTLGDTITISSDKTEYKIIIIEPGFTTWLSSIAKPEGYYSQNFLENRNNIMVLEWNNRVLQPTRFNPNLYELRIDYSQQIDYGYEVNYKLYNYFIYFQRKYNQRLGPFVPRI
ncbi:hypothetical protein LCGC14_0122890 [marine sediment metagenome]|uniref:Uncharacterized protein n=1 Tax=marine sediment metagenome TaxID=412755 RepID=A0A0F9VLZ3_9ZZZZ|nr:DUF6146 family protein [Maribacter sp.]HDZ05871.1 hypothetical protein [Maribacter sp.]HEA79571.1 hypothetical protein [Maribacter sp.]